ncbi:MAG: hypothetical protein GXP27_05190 [Planctomycetes bacterium]|nr:hypothetical protein [Planctomycetota bacterium]
MVTRFLKIVVLAGTIAAASSLPAQPPQGSHLDPDENLCATCHGEADLWDEDKRRLYISPESLARDVHFLKGVNCHDCHGGNPTSFDVPEAHSTEVTEESAEWRPFQSPLENVWDSCKNCHKHEWLGLVKGVHAHAGPKDERGRGTPLSCSKCHGEKAHGLLPVADPDSPVYLENQVEMCSECHEEHRHSYERSVHGEGLILSGLVVTAVCADCHGAHGIYYAADRRSTLHGSNVASTCGKCHYFIADRLEKSVHAQTPSEPRPADSDEKKPKHKPSCTSCHQGHHLLHPESLAFQEEQANLCGNCHADLSQGYRVSLHGQLTSLGYEPAANCSDCHGSHEILPIDDPRSRVASGPNRVQTCRKCHQNAVPSFCDFDPHANHKNVRRYPELHAAYQAMNSVMNWVFGLFAVHAFFWFARSLVHALKHGRHRTLGSEGYALVRFNPSQRFLYLLMLVSCLGLIFTGMPLKHSYRPWAQKLSTNLGGFESTSIWHHFFGATLVFVCISYAVRGVASVYRARAHGASWSQVLFGPDSLLPNRRDVRDLLGMLRWFVGLGPKPGFERWTYWEKIDFWAAAIAATVIGGSGLALWYPNVFCRLLPGSALNLAKLIHAEVALYAVSVLFFIHFFNMHFRPEKFPMDLSVLTGLVSEEHLRKARPDYIRRLEREGRLEEMRRSVPPRGRLRLALFAGAMVFSVGLLLLATLIFVSLGE